jgi:hypothetical protein
MRVALPYGHGSETPPYGLIGDSVTPLAEPRPSGSVTWCPAGTCTSKKLMALGLTD